ncbi:hypothetical protein DLM78_12470 [Leptospira stimsonii]|uniref:Uncharacterized protein n=1 Tax=Leptospira stimsonii TaxID=2202203 RepID=A0A396Z777_9LEPT|nr:hypothetical protein DLM78_12470 [Leptospira stimsonii]RHX90575.1 hypothetical protein DLM75_09175 [Leptospira stimsonii]
MLGTYLNPNRSVYSVNKIFFQPFSTKKKFFINKKELAGNPEGNDNFRQHFPEKSSSFQVSFFKLCA